MRLAYLVMLVAACGSEEGTILTVSAPEGPDNVARLEIVLANADPKTITELADQRIAPTMLAGETARYYRQRATAGAIEGVGTADGFSIRIEPNLVMVPEKTFIPFLVAFDAQDNVVGIGAVLDVEGQPSAVTIEGGGTVQYIVEMVALEPMDPALGMGDRESMHVRCGDDQRWTSGVAWRPGTTQLRLLLADRAADPAATDATDREADLDCDGHVAGRGDCDDLRAAFNPAMPEQCDGFDSNCDSARTSVQSCNGSQCASGGLQLCDDRTGEPIGACVADAQCRCEGAGDCRQCSIPSKATPTTAKAPCAPAVGKMHFPACATETAPCTIEVLGNGPWIGYLGPSPTGPFSTKLDVTVGYAYLEAKLSGTNEVTEQNAALGSLHLVITQNGQSRLEPVSLYSTDDPVTQCDTTTGSSTYPMYCTP